MPALRAGPNLMERHASFVRGYVRMAARALATAGGGHVILATATVIGEEPESIGNRLLVPYDEAIRRIARDKGCVLADMHRAFLPVLGAARLAGQRPGLTEDGVHMREAGDFLMAVAFLSAVGLPPEESVPVLASPR